MTQIAPWVVGARRRSGEVAVAARALYDKERGVVSRDESGGVPDVTIRLFDAPNPPREDGRA